MLCWRLNPIHARWAFHQLNHTPDSYIFILLLMGIVLDCIPHDSLCYTLVILSPGSSGPCSTHWNRFSCLEHGLSLHLTLWCFKDLLCRCSVSSFFFFFSDIQVILHRVSSEHPETNLTAQFFLLSIFLSFSLPNEQNWNAPLADIYGRHSSISLMWSAAIQLSLSFSASFLCSVAVAFPVCVDGLSLISLSLTKSCTPFFIIWYFLPTTGWYLTAFLLAHQP